MNILLSILFGLTFIFVIIFKLVLHIENGTSTYKICELIANISYSYVVSYIFYLVAIIPNYRNTKKVKSILLQKCKKINKAFESFMNDIKKHPRNKNIDFDDIKQWNKAINNILLLDNIQNTMITVKTSSGNTIIPKIYYHSMLDFRKSVFDTINEIKDTAAIIDQNLYSILNKIETSSLFTCINSAENIMNLQNVNNKNTITMNVLSDSLERSSIFFAELNQYIEKNIPKESKF